MYEQIQEVLDQRDFFRMRKVLTPIWNRHQEMLSTILSFLTRSDIDSYGEYDEWAHRFIQYSDKIGVNPNVEVEGEVYEVLPVELDGVTYGYTYKKL